MEAVTAELYTVDEYHQMIILTHRVMIEKAVMMRITFVISDNLTHCDNLRSDDGAARQ